MYSNILSFRYKHPSQGAMLVGAMFESISTGEHMTDVTSTIIRGIKDFSVAYITFNSKDTVDLGVLLDTEVVKDCLFHLSLLQSRHLMGCIPSDLSLNTCMECYDMYLTSNEIGSNLFEVLVFNNPDVGVDKKLNLSKSEGFSLDTFQSIIKELKYNSIEDQVEEKFNSRDYATMNSEEYYRLNKEGLNIKTITLCFYTDILSKDVSTKVLKLIDNWLFD